MFEFTSALGSAEWGPPNGVRRMSRNGGGERTRDTFVCMAVSTGPGIRVEERGREELAAGGVDMVRGA